MGPNVLVLVLDAARQDAFEPYGAVPGSTPTVSQLASRGRALDGVYATSCWTAPSHTSLFTGLMPRAAGVAVPRTPLAAKDAMSTHADRLLATVFKRAGYTTAAASANLWVSAGAGLDEGFDEFEQVDGGRNAKINSKRRREQLGWLAEAAAARADDGARALESTLASWLARPREAPFLWFVNLLECHSPYLPPRPYGGFGINERLRAARDAQRHYTLEGIWRVCCGVEQVSPDSLARLRRFYDASIRSMDDWLGRLLERMDATGVLDETLVLVLSDHGENFGEGGLIGHALSLDDRLLRVPFVAAGPGSDDLDLSSLADLPRALAGVTGIADHPWTDGPPRGFGVAQFDPPVLGDKAATVSALASLGITGEAADRYLNSLTCAVKDGFKLLRRDEREEVYDLAADPLETNPLRAQDAPAERVAELRAALEQPALTGEPLREPVAGGAPQISDEERLALEERMRLLGYL